MKTIFLLVFFVSFVYSTEIELDNLLKKYGNSKELYLETKQESAGHVTVYSRSDLDKMQAYCLNDVLKTLRMYTLQLTSNGMTTLVKAGNNQMSVSPVKIYINKHELNSVTLGNALTQYGKMSLYFIDHIEIYQASNTVTLGNEPANTIVKLYTKDPSRENGVSSQLSLDTKGGLNLRAVSAYEIGKYSYLANIDASKNNFDTYTYNDKELSRDGMRGQFYFSFAKKRSYNIEIGATNEKYDMLQGLGTSPTSNEVETNNGYLQVSKYFQDNLTLTLSASREKLIFDSQDDLGITLFDNTLGYDVQSTIKTKIYALMLDKKFTLDAHDISIGAQYKKQEFIIENFKSDSRDLTLEDAPTIKNMYIAYVEDLYTINQTNLLTLSAKINNTQNDYTSASETNHILRVGYVSSISKSFSLKAFAIESYMSPTFRQTTFSPSYNINPDLKAAKTQTTTIEAFYKKGDTTFVFGGGSSKKEDPISFDVTQNKYINSSKKAYMSRFYLNIEHNFDIKNKFIIDYFHMYSKNSYSPTRGLLLKSFNKLGKFEIYNELVIRSSYTSIDGVKVSEGRDYSLGVIYPLNKKTELKIKGVNLFDMATEVPINGVKVHAIDRRGLITLEYTL